MFISLTPYEYLLVDIANQAGFDKLHWHERVAWADSNLSQLEDYAPEADKPLLFIKAVNALRLVQQGKPTKHIMALDASSSGSSIMGLLAGCEKTLRLTNLIDTGTVSDLYTSFQVEMNTRLDSALALPRKSVKEAVMTSTYESIAVPKRIFGDKTLGLQTFYRVKADIIPATVEIPTFLRDTWNSNATEVRWTLPDGFQASFQVKASEPEILRISNLYKAEGSFSYQYLPISVPSEISIPIVANIIQSFDAWLKRSVERACMNVGISVIIVHDAFTASPVNIEFVRKAYIAACLELYSSNYMAPLLSELYGQEVGFQQTDPDLAHLIAQADYPLM